MTDKLVVALERLSKSVDCLIDSAECLTEGVWLLRVVIEEEEAPARIIQTAKPTKSGGTMGNVQLQDTQTDVIALSIADVDGNVLSGVVLDPDATVTVSDGSILTAALSTDLTSVLVTPVGPLGTGVSVTANGTVNGVTVTPDPTVYDVVSNGAAAEIVQTPGTPT